MAVAAKHAIHSGRAKRVFILDWDIHHGNGIQNLTYDDPDIFYLSIHRASFGSKKRDSWFYPGTGRPNEIGTGDGTGSNLNMVWGEGGMGDVEYAAAFSHVVLPLLESFDPDLIMIACGLDAAQGDLIGDCGLTPDMFYTMMRSILEASPSTSIVVALEGGYNIDISAQCMENVALALLDEPLDYEERKNFVCWSHKSILPQKPKVRASEIARIANFLNQKRLSAEGNKATRKALKAMKRSLEALERRCECDCEFLCVHGHSLPTKQRKIYTELTTQEFDQSKEDDLN